MKPTLKTLPNGLRVLYIPMKEQLTVTTLILVETGSKYETESQNSLAHFLEHLCFKGTTSRPSQMRIAHELDSLGAAYNAFTAQGYTGYFTKVAASAFPKAFDLVMDIYCNPLFTEAAINEERGAIMGEIAMYEDMPMRKVGDLFMTLLYGDQPAGRDIIGTKERVQSFTRQDFVNYRRMHYVPEATLVVVSGAFDPKIADKLMREKLHSLAPGKKFRKKKIIDRQSAPSALVRFKASDQTHLMLGFRTVPLGHPSYYGLALFAAILGGGMSSRLFQRVRTELGLGYYVSAGHESFTDHGVLTASAGVVNERAPEAVTAILAEFAKLKHELVSEEELRKTKDMIAGRLLLGLESSDDLSEYYGLQALLKGTLVPPKETIARIRKVTALNIRTLARKYCVTAHLNLALIGPWKDTAAFLPLLSAEK